MHLCNVLHVYIHVTWIPDLFCPDLCPEACRGTAAAWRSRDLSRESGVVNSESHEHIWKTRESLNVNVGQSEMWMLVNLKDQKSLNVNVLHTSTRFWENSRSQFSPYFVEKFLLIEFKLNLKYGHFNIC